MNPIDLLASQSWVERLGWTLLHFVWQASAIALIYAVARAAMRKAAPNARYLLACAAMLMLLAAPLATWSLLGTAPSASHASAARAIPTSWNPMPLPGALALTSLGEARVEPPVMPWIVTFWAAGAALFWIRLACGWMAAVRVPAAAQPAPSAWQRSLRQLSWSLGVTRAVRLVQSSRVHAPAVAGWLKPVILVPAGALAGLSVEQVEALLLHELAHIRRNDYLVNILQSIAEALLFYHPAVWWISSHLRAERELCCDDLAALASGDPFVYAGALAEFALHQRRSAALAMAATGGSLSRRIARLLGQPQPAAGGPNVRAIAAVLLLMAGVLAVHAQADSRPSFQVASVKRNTEANPQGMMVRPQPGGRLTTRNAPLRLLIQNAYGLQAFQVVGGPAWITTEGYDIEAKPEESVDIAKMRLMFQSLLADRFKLTVHQDTRDLPEYALVPAKGGIKPGTAPEGGCTQPDPNGPPRPMSPANPPCGRLGIIAQPTGASLVGSQTPMPELIRILGVVMGSIVIDRTGYKGTLEINLPFVADEQTAGLHEMTVGRGEAAPDPNRPSIFAALQEKLGLKLETTKGPVNVLVIDHAERPAEN